MAQSKRNATEPALSDSELRILKRIADRVRRDLARKDKSVERLAFESETSRATVRRILEANRNTGIATLDRVAKALGYRDVLEFLREI